jgi:hypothetical protein
MEVTERIVNLTNVQLCTNDFVQYAKQEDELLLDSTWVPCIAHWLHLLMEVGSGHT